MSFCKWFYGKYKKGIKQVLLFLIACFGIYILFLMLTPFLPLFSNLPLSEYDGWLYLVLYVEVCLCSVVGLIVYSIIVGVYTGYVEEVKAKKIKFKVKPQWIVYTVVMIMLFTYIGYNGGYETGDSDGFTEGFGVGLNIGWNKQWDTYYHIDMFDTLWVFYSDDTAELLNITIEDAQLMFHDTPSQPWENITSWFFLVR